MRASSPRLRLYADLSIILLAVAWGGSFVLVKFALSDISPILFLTLRFTIGTAALAALLGRRVRDIGAREWKAGLVTGACLAAGLVLQTIGLQSTTPAKSAFVTSMYIVTVPLLAALVYRIKPRWSEIGGVAAAGIGMMLLTLPPGKFTIERGDILTLGGAVCFAFHIMAMSHYAPKIAYEALALTQVAVVAAICGASFWWAETPFVRWSGALAAAILFAGIVFTAVAFVAQSWAQQYTAATRAALLFSMEPVFAALYSHYLMGETLPARGIWGAALILAGVILVELKPVTSGPHPSKQAEAVLEL